MYRHSILVYRHFRYLKLSALLVLVAVVAYVLHSPMGPPNGGTWLGYTLGTVGTVLVLLLLWLGVRKRNYASRLGTVQGWVSAHIYLGCALVVVATLHAGFQFGFNVHTLAYVLMLVVVGSGMYGVYGYLRYPPLLSSNNAGMSRAQMQREIVELHQECLLLSEHQPAAIRQVLTKAITATHLGGSLWQQLNPVRTDRPHWWQRRRKPATALPKNAVQQVYSAYDDVMYTISEHLAHTDDQTAQAEKLRRIMELWGRRNVLVQRLQQRLQYEALLRVWLYLHVPLSFGLLAALLVHIVSVFLYW